MESLYLICLLVSIGMLAWLKIYDVRNSISQYLSLILMIISNLGHYFMAISRSLDEALFGQIIGYVGGVFLPVFYFFLVLEICQFDLSKYVKIILVLFQSIIYGFVCTIGRSELFYKSVNFHMNRGHIILEKSYGPLHTVEVATMYLYLLASFVIVLYTLMKKKSVNRKSIIAMLMLMTVGVGTYALEKIIGLEFEIIPIAFDVLMMGALIPIYDSNIFTVYENKDIINEQLGKVGFLTFDKNRAYKGCNSFMENIFPELSECRPGHKLDNCSESLQNIVNQISRVEDKYIHHSGKAHVHIQLNSFLLNDRYYDGMIHILTNPFGKLMGYTIEIRDNTEHHNALNLQERYNEELAKEVEAKTKRIKTIQQKTILGMAQMVESRDLSTGGHIMRTSEVVRIFAQKLLDANLGFNRKFLELVIRSAPMHDIGKIGVDDAVLRKQGRFTDEEYNAMKKHSEIGFHMVSEILSGVEEPDFVRVAENVAHYHHEKVDGTGYPDGLKGEDIPVEARIMALADVFDALVSKRCYKEAFSYEKAYQIIEHDAGTHFDAQLARVFLSCKAELERYYNASEG